MATRTEGEMRGSTLAGRYRRGDLLGAGGMGEVWRAVDTRLGRPVAVKVIARPGDAQLVARLRREARTAAAVNDPHVVALHDTGEAHLGGRPVVYLVMELVDGEPLSQIAARGLPAVADVVRWGQQICAGLQAAHAAGVVHRDIKPANVLLTAAGAVKVCDFGIARDAGAAGHTLTGTGTVIGTPSYMSPEQARGQAVDARSDLYSLGCLLYELLTGAPPFPGSGWEVLGQHLGRRPDPVRTRRPQVPAALDELVMDLLEKDPQDRPASADQVARRLGATALPALRTLRPVPTRPDPARTVPASRSVPVGAAAATLPGSRIPLRYGVWRVGWSTRSSCSGSWRCSPRCPRSRPPSWGCWPAVASRPGMPWTCGTGPGSSGPARSCRSRWSGCSWRCWSPPR
ncbi:MAG: protein kinase [Streptomycetaceae bacterium]|nr:protein kinase [Streptomycetaceae bacterium]